MLGYWRWLYRLAKMLIKGLWVFRKTKQVKQVLWLIPDSIIVLVIAFVIIDSFLTGLGVFALGVILIMGHMIYLDLEVE